MSLLHPPNPSTQHIITIFPSQKEQSRWDLVTILPSLIVGTNLSGRDCQSQQLLKMIMTEASHGIPEVVFGVVDVRDVARAHIAAMEVDKAQVGCKYSNKRPIRRVPA